jgi:hypothetical protein
MAGFMFSLLIALLVIGLLWYLIRWAVGYLGLPQPVLVVVTVLIVICFLYWVWGAFPTGVEMPRMHR